MRKNDKIMNEKEITQSVRGIKERIKNSNNDLKETKELFLKCIYTAYLIDDISLNNKVIMAYKEAKQALEFRLDRTVYNDEIFDILRFEFELNSVMRTFYERAGKYYE